jgi:predicted glycogen debranching enzyme
MAFKIQKNILADYLSAQHYEWLETNGLGGYASASITGASTRKYHGLLVAALHPPVGRTVLLNKLDEQIEVNNQIFELGTNQYPGAISPNGHQYMSSFEKEFFPTWQYKLPNGIVMSKTIACLHEQNTTVVIYKVIKAKSAFVFKLRPYASFRDYHSVRDSSDNFNTHQIDIQNDTISIKPVDYYPAVNIKVSGSSFDEDGLWFVNMEYLREYDRGHQFHEDLYSHGEFLYTAKEGDVIEVVISTDKITTSAVKLFEQEQSRREKLLKPLQHKDEFTIQLALAADQFIVKRGEDLKTIIAGYHWFSDWGRDTMISLPGLCLATGRFEDAEKILKAFSKSVDQGMIPNRFPDLGEEPEYNTVDATLWYFVAIFQYCEAVGKNNLAQKELWATLKDIIEWHEKGTRYAIKEEDDGLLSAGEPGVQLTWMDAKIGDWVVTPRIGKPVEINALWYNALMIMAHFAPAKEKAYYKAKADKTRLSFENTFWNEDKGYLFDYVSATAQDDCLRPNQLFAISLPFELLSGSQAQKVVDAVEKHLLTPVGLRSLSPENNAFVPIYEGNQLSRDGAYHQGTVWSWLLGTYADAKLKTDPVNGPAKVKKIMLKAFKHLEEAGIGSVSEIFDGQAPFEPKGCIAQAWGVAEWLRVYQKCMTS